MKAILSLAVDIPDDLDGADFEELVDAIRFSFALNGIRSSKMRVEFRSAKDKPLPKVNVCVPAGKPS